ncbi:hypothetical protein JXB12_12740 [candidate division KSB1 bacterium]|nr:hypothetical protein [candidate division KSB1 bacterium]
MLKKKIIFILMCCSVTVTSLSAGTTYKINRLGQFSYFNQPTLLGRGGTGLSVTDPNSINVLNPAAMIAIPVTKFEAELMHESTDIKSLDMDGLSHYTNVNGVRFAVPLIVDKLVIGFGMRPLTYNFLEASESDYLSTGNKYTREIDIKGGLNQISFGVATSYRGRYFLGINANFNFGKAEEVWRVIFVSDLFRDTKDQIVTKMWGGSVTAGLIADITKNWSVGAIYASGVPLNVNNRIKYTFGEATKTVRSDLWIPHMFGAGTSYTLQNRTRFLVDYLYHPLSKFELDGVTSGNLDDNHSVSLGCELLPVSGYLQPYRKKITYRIGFNFSSLGYPDDQGNKASEYLATLGFGLPYYGGFGRLDFAFAYGKRGNLDSNMFEETIYKLTFSVSGGEKWFVRPK